MRDVIVVDNESVDPAEEVVVGGRHRARASDLDLPLRNAVVRDVDVAHTADAGKARELGPFVVRKGEDFFDADVPVRIARRRLAEPKVGDFLHMIEPEYVLGRATQEDLVFVAAGLDELDRNEPGAPVAPRGLGDEMGDSFRNRGR